MMTMMEMILKMKILAAAFQVRFNRPFFYFNNEMLFVTCYFRYKLLNETSRNWQPSVLYGLVVRRMLIKI